MYPIIALCLFVSQSWGAWVLWKLGAKMMERYKVSCFDQSTMSLNHSYQKELIAMNDDKEDPSDIALSSQTITEIKEIDSQVNAMSMVFF